MYIYMLQKLNAHVFVWVWKSLCFRSCNDANLLTKWFIERAHEIESRASLVSIKLLEVFAYCVLYSWKLELKVETVENWSEKLNLCWCYFSSHRFDVIMEFL